MTNRDKITEILYKNSFDTSEGLTIRFEKISKLIDDLEALSICEVSRSKQADEATEIDRIRQNKWIDEINEGWLKTLKEHHNLRQSIEDKTIR